MPSNETPSDQDNENATQGVLASALAYTGQPVTIDQQEGYAVLEIADGIYWLVVATRRCFLLQAKA